MAESPSTYFPDYRAQFGYQSQRQYVTEILTARSGREQRRKANTNPRRLIAYNTIPLVQAARRAIADFLHARSGDFEPFYLFVPVPEDVSSLSVGTVSSATSLTLPLKGPWWINETPVESTLVSVTVGGGAVTDPMITPNIGTGGEDRLSWTGSASGAVVLTATSVRLRLTVRSAVPDVMQAFMPRVSDVYAVFPLRFMELVS